MDSHLDMDAAGTDRLWRGRHGIGRRTVLGGGLALGAIPLLQLPLAQTAQAQAT
ncbi:MAG TPA: hypothetical protein VK908_17675 [Jiangellales bacterium]|nr:hypothetical protein [Jiangellales bacterium]